MQATPASRVASYAIRAALICALALAGGAAAAGNLFPDPVFPVTHPSNVAAGDFNGDGAIDLAAASFSTGDVSILLSDGHGEFEPGPSFTTAGAPTGLAAADLNADGKIDLAVAEYANSIAVFLGAGDGAFVFNDRYPIGPTPLYSPSFITAADLNLDGAPDLVVASATADVSVFIGKGDGTFQSSTHSPSGQGNTSVAVVDFNLDGNLDLALTTADEPQDGVVLFGLGNGLFSLPAPLGGDRGGFFMAAADFNRDGRPDLAVSGYYDNQLSVLLGDGTGGILSRDEIEIPPGQVAAIGQWLGAADFDGDAIADLAISEGVLPGLGDGTFGPLVPFFPQFSSINAIADLDADGVPDLAAPNGFDGVAVLYNDHAGHLGPRIDPPREFVADLVEGDFNGDGLTDLVGVKSATGSPFIVIGQPGGTFGPESEIPIRRIASIAPGDFDGDGMLDFAYTLSSSGSVFVMRGLGDGAFQGPIESNVGIEDGILVTGEFNADGRDDLVALDSSQYFRVLVARMDATFEASQPIGPPLHAVAAAVGDFNSDHLPDLAVAYPGISSVTIFKGRGDGTFETGGSYGAGPYLGFLAVADLNEDGTPDLAAGYAPGPILPGPPPPGLIPKVSVLLGNGDASFAEKVEYEVGRFGKVGVADFDRDGHLDVLSGGASILPGAGDGTFGPALEYAHWGGFVIDDFNQDGGPDLALVRNGISGIVVALNEGAPAGSLAAHADAETQIECASHEGAEVLLDGSASTGDIATFEWFEDYGQTGQMLLGTGETLHVTLAPGVHPITLRVTDPAGAQATDEITVTIADSVAPEITVQLTPDQLWPANNKMVEVTAHVTATDACGRPIDIKLTSIQEEGFAGNGRQGNVSGAGMGTADFSFQLRAARSSSKQGAGYRVTYTATDASGNQAAATALVLVPHDHRSPQAQGRAQPPKP